MLCKLGANDAQPSGHIGRARAQLPLAGHIVKVDPDAIIACHDALCTQNHAIFPAVQRLQGRLKLRTVELFRRLHAPAGEYLIGIVTVMVVVMSARIFVVEIVVVMLAATFLVVVMMVSAAAIAVIVVVMMMVLVLLILIVVVMMSAAAVAFIFIVFVMMMFVLMHFFI